MAKLKERGVVLKRDDGFSRRLNLAKSAEPVAPAAPPVEKSPLVTSPEAPGQSIRSHERQHDQAPPPTKLKPTAPSTGKPETSATAVQSKAGLAMPDAADTSKRPKVRLRISFRCPSDLASRAAAWAENARCPVSAVFRKAMGEIRPQLIARVEAGIAYTDVPNERMTDASHAFETSIMITQIAYDRLAKEIDPESMTGIEAPMSRWARAQFLPHFDAWLTSKGR